MAIYPYKCSNCDGTVEIHQRISEYSKQPNTPKCCGELMQRVITVPFMQTDIQPFKSHMDGAVINSKSDQREYMARTGYVLHDDFAPEVPKIRAAITKKVDDDRKEDIIEAIAKLDQGYKPPPLEKKAEVLDEAGTDFEVRTDLLTEEA